MADAPKPPGMFTKLTAALGAPDKLLQTGIGVVVGIIITLAFTCKQVKPGATVVKRDTAVTVSHDTTREQVYIPYRVLRHDTTIQIKNTVVVRQGDTISVASLTTHDTVKTTIQDSIIRHDTLSLRNGELLRYGLYGDLSAGLFGPPPRVAAGIYLRIGAKYEPYAQLEYQTQATPGVRVGIRIAF